MREARRESKASVARRGGRFASFDATAVDFR